MPWWYRHAYAWAVGASRVLWADRTVDGRGAWASRVGTGRQEAGKAKGVAHVAWACR
jgi:hypothetical protein